VGLYTRRAPSGDTLAKIREVGAGLSRYPFLIEEWPMPKGLPGMLDEVSAALEKAGYQTEALAAGGRSGAPKMHRKTQLFVSRSVLRALATDPATLETLRGQLDAIAEVTSHPESVLEEDDPLTRKNPILRRMRDDPPAEAKGALYYLTVGSKNQDPRSAFLDGETAFVVSGPSALWSYADFVFLMAATTWVESAKQLSELIPSTGWKSRKYGRLARRVL
jgi:Asp-tRNA(Asn)/Glu-tRNA(Gln) amidotransferase C subunit